MRRLQTFVGLGLASAVLLGVLGLWLWGKPRTTVAVPAVSSAPAEVVRTFAHALNDRDFSAAKKMVVGDRVGVKSQWWDVHGPRVEDLQVMKTGPVTSGARCGAEAAKAWKQCVKVDTEAKLRHVQGATESATPTREPWSYYLVRNSDSEHWRILDWQNG